MEEQFIQAITEMDITIKHLAQMAEDNQLKWEKQVAMNGDLIKECKMLRDKVMELDAQLGVQIPRIDDIENKIDWSK